MVIVVIRTQLRDDADLAAYGEAGARMDALVRTLPGFVAANEYASADGDHISLVTFDSAEALLGWRNHPEHVEVQRLGKEVFYASYTVQVCEVVRSYGSPAP